MKKIFFKFSFLVVVAAAFFSVACAGPAPDDEGFDDNQGYFGGGLSGDTGYVSNDMNFGTARDDLQVNTDESYSGDTQE